MAKLVAVVNGEHVSITPTQRAAFEAVGVQVIEVKDVPLSDISNTDSVGSVLVKVRGQRTRRIRLNATELEELLASHPYFQHLVEVSDSSGYVQTSEARGKRAWAVASSLIGEGQRGRLPQTVHDLWEATDDSERQRWISSAASE